MPSSCAWFVVSTHSPFLAVGRQPGEIIRVRRDPATRKAMAEQFERDTSRMTVSDVLTSYLFGLQSQVDHDLQQDVLEMRKLSVKPTLSEEERAKLGTLEERLRDVGVASVSADPLYGRYLDELSKAKKASVLKFPPLTKEEEDLNRQWIRGHRRTLIGSLDEQLDTAEKSYQLWKKKKTPEARLAYRTALKGLRSSIAQDAEFSAAARAFLSKRGTSQAANALFETGDW